MVDKLPSVSPGEALRLRQAEHRQTRAFSELATALLDGRVAGDDVQRLHSAIQDSGGDRDKLSLVETELALRQLLSLNNRVMDQIRNLR